MKKHLTRLLSAALVVCTLAVPTVKANAATQIPSDANLLNTYGKVFDKVGTAIPASAMLNNNTMKYATKEYNSLTAENEMKPDAILGYAPKLISVAEAKSLGYYIPDGYTESTVPQLNFDTVDKMLKACYDNGMKMRGHTLVWHSQTPDWYFKNGYNKNSGYVSQDVMNKRTEFYIKTVMNHVYTGKYKDVVYTWDVVNEFLHAQKSGWEYIYGKHNTRAKFVKDAYQYAYETLKYFKLENKVKLFYNDYNTYMEVNDVIDLINYINSDKKICAGVGMQSHLTTEFPSVAYYKQALDAFAKAGFEIQITELDVGSNSSEKQAKYCYDLMSAILQSKKSGANITALVWWGLSDDTSWRKKESPLLYSNYTTKKPSYNSVLQAYYDSAYGQGTGNNNSNNNNNTNNNQGNTSTSTGTLSDGWYYIKNVNAQKYLQVTGNTGKAAQNVELGKGTGVAGQKWYLTNTNDGYITLKSALGNYMLDVINAENKDGSNIRLYNAYSNNAQKFALKQSAVKGQYGILTMSSNKTKALDDYNFITSDGANVCQWTYNETKNQLWIFEKASN